MRVTYAVIDQTDFIAFPAPCIWAIFEVFSESACCMATSAVTTAQGQSVRAMPSSPLFIFSFTDRGLASSCLQETVQSPAFYFRTTGLFFAHRRKA